MWHDSFAHGDLLVRVLWWGGSNHTALRHALHMHHMTHLYMWHDSFVHVTWLIRRCDMTHSHMVTCWYVCYDEVAQTTQPSAMHFICITWLIRTRDMTHSCVTHDSFVCVPRRIHVWQITSLYVWREAEHIAFPPYDWWLIRMCDLAHSYVWPSSFMGDTWLFHMQHVRHNIPLSAMFFTCDSWLIRTCAMTHSCVAHGFFVSVTHDSFVFVTWSKHKSHSPPPCSACVTYGSSRVSHDSVICRTWLIRTWLLCMRDMK
jgi:hypothetical protein